MIKQALNKLQSKRSRGAQAEQRARQFLERAGLNFVAANVRGGGGEIDLIMREQTTLVFVEVRLRGNQRFASASESVNAAKQRKLLQAAQYYLQREKLTDKVPCRFDVVALQTLDSERQPEWIKNAFGAV
ncbi:YraN family protein [Gilvimarinus agarilyticus]|uniref:YraN family protein n=1 Tax=Gilvimarinus agarilyticus TaxID=679259 RepID=UPI00059F3659|nr:YraN family protein [Gilvimarinus agarilyticus]